MGKKTLLFCSSMTAILCAWSPSVVRAAPVTWVTAPGSTTADNSAASAAAVFNVNGAGNLTITLYNTALPADVKTPADVLTNLEFNLTGATLGITAASSVMVSPGSTLQNYTAASNYPDISNGWVFGTTVTPAGLPSHTGPFNYGVSATSFINGSGIVRFDGTSSGGDPPPPDLGNIDGADFGLVPVGTTFENMPEAPGAYGLVANSVIITLTKLSGTIDLTKISNVYFTYGSEQEGAAGVPGTVTIAETPEPATLAMVASGLIPMGLVWLRRRRRRSESDTV